MAELYDVITDVVKDVVSNMDPTGITYGTVVNTNPLTLEIQSTKLRIAEPVVVLCDAVQRKTKMIGGEEIELYPGLRTGDKVLALKANSGQSYIILSKV